MPYSDAQRRATSAYKKKVDMVQISLDMRREERDRIKVFAASKGMSVRAYILQLIEEDMQKETYE